MAKAMAERGFTRSVERVFELIGDDKKQAAQDLAGKLIEWIRGVEQFGKAPTANADKEAMSEVEQRAAEVAQREENIFRGQVGGEITRTMKRIISRHLTPLLKGRNLTLQQKQDLAGGIFSHISGSLQKNQTYQERFRSLLDNHDAVGANRYAGSQVDRIAKKAVQTVWANRGFASAGVRRAAANGNRGAGGASGPAVMGKKPSADKIDWDKDRSKMRYMAGEATLKKEFGGKIVRWDRNAL
jgi:hypothetical protein